MNWLSITLTDLFDDKSKDLTFTYRNINFSLRGAEITYRQLNPDDLNNYINIPYNEITVKRRVYRTGENEYFINNEKCRLKDITDLFLDSGIGKSSFNIICINIA